MEIFQMVKARRCPGRFDFWRLIDVLSTCLVTMLMFIWMASVLQITSQSLAEDISGLNLMPSVIQGNYNEPFIYNSMLSKSDIYNDLRHLDGQIPSEVILRVSDNIEDISK